MSADAAYVTEAGPFIVKTLVTGTWRENCYLVTHRASGEALLFDPGDEAERLLRELDGVNVKRLLLTHAHYDHIGAALAIGAARGLACEVHENDAALLKKAPLYALAFEKRRIQLPTDVRTFADEAVFTLGDTHFTAIPAPGHTPGGVAFVTDDVVISGDTLLREAVGRVDLPGGDAQALAGGIDTLLARISPRATLFPGHGRPWPVDEARAWWAARQGA